MNIKKQKAGTTLSVTAKDAARNTSKAAIIKVEKSKCHFSTKIASGRR